ncbi:MAG: peroxiredoxin Q/BCP, partial [Yoonia sp.]
MSTLSIGDTAPAINLPRDGGKMVDLAAMTGQKVVVYFYPKDDTPGCTKEAIGFTEAAADFAAAGAVVWGVSKDSVAKHEKFR